MRRLLIVLTLLLCTRPARADIASSVYGDVRDVIEELIQTEVTTSVVRTVKERSPALGFYMRGTLERLGSPYWGSLGRVLKEDITVVVADFVYWHVSTGATDGDIVKSAKAFFACARSMGTKSASKDPACVRLIGAIESGRPLVEVECRRSKPTADRRVACDLGLAVLAALKGRGEARRHLVDMLADIVLLEVGDKDVGARMRDVLTRWLDLPKDLPTPLLEALAAPDLGAELTDDALEKRCKDWNEMRRALDDPSNPVSWLCFAITHDSVRDLLQASVTIRENGKTLTKKVDHWVIANALKDLDSDRVDEDGMYRIFAELAFDAECPAKETPSDTWPCSGKRLEPGATVSVYWLRRPPFGMTVNQAGKLVGSAPPKFLITSALKFRRLDRRVQELRAALPPSLGKFLFHAGQTVSTDTKAALRAVYRMARLVSELRGRWYLWSQNARSFEELDVAELIRVARSSLDQSVIERNAVLAFLDRPVGGASTLDIGDWLRLVMRADYRSLAMETLRAALDLPLSNATNRPRETFFLSLSAYLLDNSEGVGEVVARSAFRASAKELLLSSTKRGIPRSDARLRFRLTPRLAARLSFNESYAATDDDTRRNVVAADWPTMMVALSDYVGIELSVIDFVAPLGELALRPAGVYTNEKYVALDLLRPRAGIWVAVPQFSRRLTLSTGFGGRFLDVVRTDDGTNPDIVNARYRSKASLTFDAGLQFVF